MVREIFLFVPLPSSSHIPILSPNLPTFSFPGSVFDSSRLFFGPQWCAFLIFSLLFYSFFHFLCHLFCLTLTVYMSSLSRSLSLLLCLCIFTRSQLHPPPSPIPFPPELLFSMYTAVVWLCVQEMWISAVLHVWNLWWARDFYHLIYVRACVCRHNLHDCVCGWMQAHGFLCLWVCVHMHLCVCVCLCRIILIILTSQCPILGKREARVGGGRGWERENGREMFCHHGKHPSNEQQSQISDSP